jgi:hypothetical protein
MDQMPIRRRNFCGLAPDFPTGRKAPQGTAAPVDFCRCSGELISPIGGVKRLQRTCFVGPRLFLAEPRTYKTGLMRCIGCYAWLSPPILDYGTQPTRCTSGA